MNANVDEFLIQISLFKRDLNDLFNQNKKISFLLHLYLKKFFNFN